MTRTSQRVMSAVVISVGLAFGAGSAAALDSSFEAMSQAGTHQFYVWCTGDKDYVESEDGNNAKEAQEILWQKSPGTCWPVWQGRKES